MLPAAKLQIFDATHYSQEIDAEKMDALCAEIVNAAYEGRHSYTTKYPIRLSNKGKMLVLDGFLTRAEEIYLTLLGYRVHIDGRDYRQITFYW